MQRLWAGVVFAWKGYRNFGKRGFEVQSLTWDPKDLEVDLSTKTAIITGANSGLGKCVALFLASRGANVHILCRNKERGEEARNQIIEETKNEKIYLHVVDVSESKQILEVGISIFSVVKKILNSANSLGKNGYWRKHQLIFL